MIRFSLMFVCILAGCLSQLLECVGDEFEKSILPILRESCNTCHSTEKVEGELDLERFDSLGVIKQHTEVWEQVLHQLELGEMPPKGSKQLSNQQKQQLIGWVRKTLDEVALANAGDPGAVVLRRLSNHEYTYTLRDLTGIDTLEPARDFPVDGAAGEGFTNVGAALVMSPALLTKYLDAAKEVSRHMVLLDDGIRFSSSDSQQDWTDETLAAIRNFYARYTTYGDASKSVQQGIPLDVGTETGRLPLQRYLDAVQGRGDTAHLSPKYLKLLREALEASQPSPLLAPLIQKYRAKQLTAADIEAWQKLLWRFANVGHIGKVNGPKAWQEPVTPLVARQELQWKFEGNRDHTVYLVATNAGDGDKGDVVVWESPRLVAKGRPDLPIQNLSEVIAYLEAKRTQLVADSEACLAALAAGNENAPPESLAMWREYLGFGFSTLEPLMVRKMESASGYNFVQGWVGDNALSVLANSSDNSVRIPGVMPGHSVATHPAPDRAAVIAWKSSAASKLMIQGSVVHAHPECGNGIAWSVEVRRGANVERLASGFSERSKVLTFGPFENVRIEPEQVVALVVSPRDGNHSCDMTTVNLTIHDGTRTWDLAKDVSPNILAGNPHGPWHFLSQPASQDIGTELPAPIAQWRKSPSAELAVQVREHLAKEFPLTHPLLAVALKSYKPSGTTVNLTARAPAIEEIKIPAVLAEGATLVVTGRLASNDAGSVQMQILPNKPANNQTIIAGEASTTQQKAQWSDNRLVTQYSSPIIVNDNSPERKRFEAAFDEFRSLFPLALCYDRIVPVDEVVTLTLYYREDDHLQRLMLEEAEVLELNRLWNQLRFISQAPIKQVDAFEQLWQFATQDADPSAFEPLREPLKAQAAAFRKVQEEAVPLQKQAIIKFAAQAWRRPLNAKEVAELETFSPRLMLVRVLASPAFLYRGEQTPQVTGAVSDWELASRLSYFLWSSAPDEQLSLLAAQGKLRDPDVLGAQARRMLKDVRMRRLATEFGCQYLHVRDVAELDEKSERHFPTFVQLREDMQEEVTRFYVDMFQNNRSVLALLAADYSFINKPLADHYGLPFEGDGWQRVEGLRAHGRGGVLGFAATLAKHSGASRTSAILRGTWISEVMLGEKIPNPPQGVPTLPEEAPAGLSERQLIERHSSDEKCAGCHNRIDPFGFALEGFDAIGRIRKADTQTVLYDGTAIAGMSELREYFLRKRSADFLKQFNRKLLGYALGRSVQLSDHPLIEKLTQVEGQAVGDIIELIVRSQQFREIRGEERLVRD
ncbi:MAG: DUF1592 domain-containing protein [Pirellulaceae bacterium]|nr:DUF1592 domain-containing protein [Pirellulaceae bacterium]